MLAFEKCFGLRYSFTFTTVRFVVASTTSLSERAVKRAELLAAVFSTVAILAAARGAQTPPMQRTIVEATTISARGPPEVRLAVAYSIAGALPVTTTIGRTGLLVTCTACPHLTWERSKFIADWVTLACAHGRIACPVHHEADRAICTLVPAFTLAFSTHAFAMEKTFVWTRFELTAFACEARVTLTAVVDAFTML